MATERFFKFDEGKWRECAITDIYEGDRYAWVLDDEIIGYYRALHRAKILSKGLIESETADLPVLDPKIWRVTPSRAIRFLGIELLWLIIAAFATSFDIYWLIAAWTINIGLLLAFVLQLAIIQPKWFTRRFQ